MIIVLVHFKPYHNIYNNLTSYCMLCDGSIKMNQFGIPISSNLLFLLSFITIKYKSFYIEPIYTITLTT